MLKKTQIAILIYVIATLQVVGYAGKMWLDGSRLSNFLFLNTGWSEAFCTTISHSTIALMGVAILWAFFKWSSGPFFLLGLIFLLEAVSRTLLGGEFAASYALPAEAARYLWLLAVAYALVWQRKLEQVKTVPLVPQLFQWALALTFLTHGIEALQTHPQFVDMLIVGSRKLLPWSLTEVHARQILFGIGLVDVLCAIGVVWRPQRGLLIYMAVWGLITAIARIIFNPQLGVFDALMRTVHVGLPFLILLLSTPRASTRTRIFSSPKRLFQRGRVY